MKTYRYRLLSTALCLLLLTGMGYAKTHKSKKDTASAKSGKVHRFSRKRGQQAMNPSRVREIQAALIREKYLDGQPTGIWDQRSKEAMQNFQSKNGWQTKVIPDSRALIKLGLGPDHANLINPETAATSFIPGGGSPSHKESF
ncbi:MAG TPA: peptidoglycan-binding domain-containing protein [Terriglobales bacterium]|nr:peptidoglycan-binding domain-containing protein [Terriglobales bacterium]